MKLCFDFRLKLHEVTKERFPSLASFSVGDEAERRPVICRQSVIADWTLKSVNSIEAIKQVPVATSASAATFPASKSGASNKRPEKALYVPRALRQKMEAAQQPQQSVQPQVIPQIKVGTFFGTCFFNFNGKKT